MPISVSKQDLDFRAPSKITQDGKAEFSSHPSPYQEDTTSCFLPLRIWENAEFYLLSSNQN